MRSVKLATFAVLAASLAVPTLAHADAIPNGLYYLVTQDGTGIHLSTGTLIGTVTYAGGVVTAADIVFTSATTHVSYTFDTPGATTVGDIFSTPDLLETEITDSADPNASYSLSVEYPSNPDSSFRLTCGVDCDTEVDLGSPTFESEEFTGRIVPTPEPSSIILFATGALGLAQSIRRRDVKA
jgi:PEP-CTERM motif